MHVDLRAWLDLLLRMAHFIAGIMWIGTSFYFVWLDTSFEPPTKPEKGLDGESHLVHGGLFFRVEKRRYGPGQMPQHLHWFIWEATFTWITGFLLLWLMYYTTGGIYLVDPAVRALSPWLATGLGIAFLAAGWLVYDGLFRSPLGKTPVANALALALAGGAAYLLTDLFSGRGAFIHFGAMLGTIMVLNVWVHILPNQRTIIRAAEEGREPDYELGKKAKQRSLHNSYMTLGVLFAMLSNHFPSFYAAPHNAAVLLLLAAAGAFVRHTMISLKAWPSVVAAAALAGVFVLTARPRAAMTAYAKGPPVTYTQVYAVVQGRCVQCHSTHPTDDIFRTAPAGLTFDSGANIQPFAERIFDRVVLQRTMPLANKTGMTDEERALIGRWIAQGARVD